jgi:hypothetical protein
MQAGYFEHPINIIKTMVSGRAVGSEVPPNTCLFSASAKYSIASNTA